jgi:hypothetical protein
MCDMLKFKHAKKTEIGVANVTPNRKLQKTFEKAFTEFESGISRGCNLGRIVPALRGKGYKPGSPFLKKFTAMDLRCEPVDGLLSLEMTSDGKAAYDMLAGQDAEIYPLTDIDSVPGGMAVRRRIEAAASTLTLASHDICEKRQGRYLWSVQLFGSSQSNDGSVLVFRLDSKDLLPQPSAKAHPLEIAEHTMRHGVFLVIATSESVDSDGRAVAKFMREKGYRNVEFVPL